MNYTDSYWDDVDRIIPHIPNKEKLKEKRVLITGATGLLCSPVVDVLIHLNRAYGYGIRTILAGRSPERQKKRFSDIDDGNISYIHYDLEDDEAISAEVDYIIHGAGIANPVDYATKPVEILYGTVNGIKKVLDTCRNNKGSRLLYVSSSEVYGFRNDDNMDPYDEDECNYLNTLASRSCYPQAKRSAETLCTAYISEYDIEAVIARPGHVYGPSVTETDGRAGSVFARIAKSEGCVKMKGAGNQLRSYCYTLDCASALLTVLLNGANGEAYNVSNPNSVVTIRDLAEGFAEAVGGEIIMENPSDTEKAGYAKMTNSSLKSDKLWAGKANLI